MTWQGCTRRNRLPSNWQAIRQQILDRDGWRCTVIRHDSTRCWDKATDVDHINRGDDHSSGNLASICEFHHRKKSAAEGNAARTAKDRLSNKRHAERHPGFR